MIVGRRAAPERCRWSVISARCIGTAAVMLVIMALFSGQRLSGFRAPIYLWFLGLALIPQLLGHTSYNYALGYLPAAFVSVAVLAEPIGTSLLAVLVLSEIPSGLEIIGGVIILVGIGYRPGKRV